ncbi:3-hydroxyacyl-CoA dehydrogenase family protein [Sphingomonas sp. 2SG]|uniref:3-hydroxyacyl-CoA dehydrogenase family protein n=1 Tax=Sphingomonas sp. 2SG TaxID=2502201 RepID=UPI0010F9A9C1|nr:3-hydroxyacyl-CoA dehydrogenase family protein [Sphingomonas sp. 2SG]
MNASLDYRASGPSRSFPDGLPVAAGDGAGDGGGARVLILAGDAPVLPDDIQCFAAVLVEVGRTCLAMLVPDAPANVFGFARFRLGDAAPTNLVELVRGEQADPAALDTARAALEGAGFQVSVCADRMGRIVDRLVRPHFNLAYAAVDSGLATRDAIESCVRSGLGYRQGLMTAVEQGGLADHYDVSSALFEAYGLAQFAPARQAIVARQRKDAGR